MKKIIVAALLLISSALHADELADRVAKIAATTDATVGISAIDVISGRRLTLRGDERFPMASVYKVPIALAVLKKVTDGQLSLDDPITIAPKDFVLDYSPLAKEAKGKAVTVPMGNLIVRAVGESDNTAADALLRLAGGPEAVTRYLRFIGITGMDVSRSEKAIAADSKKGAFKQGDERDTSTPNAMAMLLRQSDARAEGIGSATRNFLTDIMRNSKSGLRRIRAGVPNAADVFDKTGTAPGVLNDIAVVKSPDGLHRIIIVVFTKEAKKSSEAAREAMIAAIAREIYTDFTTWQH